MPEKTAGHLIHHLLCSSDYLKFATQVLRGNTNKSSMQRMSHCPAYFEQPE